MPLRPLAVSILLFIVLIVAVYEVYVRMQAKHLYYPITHTLKWIGVIDMDKNHGLDMQGIIDGHDVLLVADYGNPIFQQIITANQTKNILPDLSNFELSDYDSNNDGLISIEDPIFHYLRIIFFNPKPQGFQVRSLHSAGIHAIKAKTIDQAGDHQVVLSDGSTHTLYSINKPTGTAIYKTHQGTTVTTLPPPTTPIP